MRRLLLPILLVTAGPALADIERQAIGGDLYVAGSGTADASAERDLFVAGGTVTARGTVGQDGHFMGMDVEIEAEVTGDVYAAGGTVTLRAPVGEDLTAAGFSLRTGEDSRVGGNARLAGGSVVVDGPVAGALLASGGEVALNAEIGGDVRILAGKVSFGEGARIGGRLDYTAPEEVAIPASVIDPARVSFTRSEEWEHMAEASRDWADREYPVLPGASAVFGFLLVTIGFFVVLAAAALALAPERIEAMRREALARPWLALLGGVLGLATVLGLAPVAVMTVLGLPLLPAILLLALLLWILGYALGVYTVALRIWTGMGGAEPAMA
jgi:cytoskeletal protein CcmA (bactofilin family)